MFSFPGTQKYFMEYTSEPFADADVRVGVAICHGWRRRFEFVKARKICEIWVPERLSEIGRQNSFSQESEMFFYRTHLGIDVCFFSSRYRYSGRGVRYVFLRSVRIFSPPARESCGRFSNSKELIQRSFDALAFRRSRYGNSEKELVRICFLFLMNSCYKVFEIECSLYCYV